MAAQISTSTDPNWDPLSFYLFPGEPYLTAGPIQAEQPFNLLIQDGDTSDTYASVSPAIAITGRITQTYSPQTGETYLSQLTGSLDYLRPTNTITAPVNGQHWSNSVFMVTGKAVDNVAVSNVLVSLNGGDWTPAALADNGSNWTNQVSLMPGTNVVSAYAMDTSGNVSLTNTVKIRLCGERAADGANYRERQRESQLQRPTSGDWKQLCHESRREQWICV